MDVFINVTGLEDLQRELADLPRHIVEDCFPDALAAAGAVIEDEVRRRTPEAEVETTSAKKYGPLVDALSTDVETDEQHLSGDVKVGFKNSGSGFVAVMVEYGHRDIAHGATYADRKNGYPSHSLGSSTPAHPFIRQAGAASEEAAVDAFTESLTENIDR